MDFAAIEEALRTIVSNCTGIERPCVIFENAPRPRHNGRTALLSWVSMAGPALDSAAWEYAENTDPLLEMTPSAEGAREVSLQVGVEVYNDARPGHSAAAIAGRARTRLAWPSSLAALAAVDLALATVGASTQADYRGDGGRMVSRRVFEVRLNAVSREVDEAGRTSYIATAEVTGTVVDAASASVSDSIQPQEGP